MTMLEQASVTPDGGGEMPDRSPGRKPTGNEQPVSQLVLVVVWGERGGREGREVEREGGSVL